MRIESKRRLRTMAGATVAGLTLGLACAAADDVSSMPCTQLLCEGGSLSCCDPALPGTWDPTGRYCNCPPPPEPDADADGDLGPGPDADADAPADIAGPDADADTAEPCTYPPGPYSFTHRHITPPMRWPSAIAGPAETLPADTEVLRCDPSVKSIFLQVTTTTCPTCAERMGTIAGLASTWAANGTKWIFVVGDAASASVANSYVNRYGIDFGWRTNDADNSAGSGMVAGSSNFAAVPWTGVIRPATMELVCDEPDDTYLDIRRISDALAADPFADLSRYCTNH